MVHDLGEVVFTRLRGEKALGLARRSLEKGASGDVTSGIDRAAEDLVLAFLKDKGTPCRVLSEERGLLHLGTGSPQVDFVVDPVDGSSNAAMGLPYYALCVYARAPGAEVGLVRNLVTGDEYAALRGHGASRNGQAISTSGARHLDGAVALLTNAVSAEDYQGLRSLFLAPGTIRVLGSIALDLCAVAAGLADVAIEYHVNRAYLRSVDLAAAQVILEEAGGVALDERGDRVCVDFDLEKRYHCFGAATEALARQAVALVRPAQAAPPSTSSG
ncbi:MAG: hypothetical protein HY683_10730 [Chloroflexi bacterium]|nr:hypothetical protein [Chloroflexota bacterium]